MASGTKDSHVKGWFTEIGTAYLASGVVDELPRKTLFALLSFISGYLPSAKKPANLGKQNCVSKKFLKEFTIKNVFFVFLPRVIKILEKIDLCLEISL